MNCKQAQRLLVPYINGELDEKEEGEFVKHIRHCPECYEELEVYATVFAGIRQLDGAEVQDERFLYTYVLFLRAAAIMALIYMIARWLF